MPVTFKRTVSDWAPRRQSLTGKASGFFFGACRRLEDFFKKALLLRVFRSNGISINSKTIVSRGQGARLYCPYITGGDSGTLKTHKILSQCQRRRRCNVPCFFSLRRALHRARGRVDYRCDQTILRQPTSLSPQCEDKMPLHEALTCSSFSPVVP